MQKGSAYFTVDILASLFWAIGGNWRPRVVTRAFKKRNAVKDVGPGLPPCVIYTVVGPRQSALLLFGLGLLTGKPISEKTEYPSRIVTIPNRESTIRYPGLIRITRNPKSRFQTEIPDSNRNPKSSDTRIETEITIPPNSYLWIRSSHYTLAWTIWPY